MPNFGRKIYSEAAIWKTEKVRADNIKLDIYAAPCENVNWIGLVRDRV
jgi:hypothetical protein